VNTTVGTALVNTLADVSVTQSRSIIAPSGTDTNCPENATFTPKFNPSCPGNRHSVLYTVTANNAGPSDAQNVRVSDTFDATTLDATSAKYCVVVPSSEPCTNLAHFTPYTTNGGQVGSTTAALNPMVPGATVSVKFWIPVQSGKRGGPLALNNTASAASTGTGATQDPDTSNNSNTTTGQTIFTVPDAPTLQAAEPGNNVIDLMWTVPATGGSAITGYDIILDGTPSFVTSGFTSVTCGTDSCLTYEINAPNKTGNPPASYTVKVEARNAAGDSDSDPTGGLQAAPCSTCVSRLVPNNQQTTLNTASLAVNSGQCFPPSTDSTKPGATTSDPVVSCFQLTAQQAQAKAGFVTALRETGVVSGQYGCGTGTCIGGSQAVSLLIPPGSGTSTQIVQTVLYDKTVGSSAGGDLCNALPCPSKAKIYDVFLNNAFIGSSLTNGDSATGRPAWCTLQHPVAFDPKNPTAGFNPDPGPNQNLYQIPANQTACVVSYVHINTSQKASKVNGNTPNGKEGNADFRLDIVFEGDGGLTTCRTCR
jgi:hypothetical protein